MSPTQKTLIALGVLFIVVAFAWPVISKLGLGRLPGDIRIERDGFAFYFPLTTMILLSVIATIVLRWLGK